MAVAAWLLALLLFGLWLLLVVVGLHLLRLGLWAWQAPTVAASTPPLGDLDEEKDWLPTVTVQLPMCNEIFVARRAIVAATLLKWPRERIDIQVLDDSDDETSAVIDEAVAAVRKLGHRVTVVRRENRRGYKAGNLQNALPLCQGEFIAVLDADFLPPPDFLRRLLPAFRDDAKLAFVQGRWSFLNEDESLLCRVQALILHGLMLVEQPYLSAHARPVQFNGTGGVWRKAALIEAGGWLGDEAASVTEDLDLSLRAYQLGYHGRHLAEVAVPTELPATMAAFRAQQQRWVRGGAQVLRSLFNKLGQGALTSPERKRAGLSLLGHLLRHARQPYLSLSLLWLPLLSLGWLRPAVRPPGGLLAALLFLAMAVTVYYGAALRRLGRSPLAAVKHALLLLPLSVGLSLGLSAALLRGLFFGRESATFVRTPKTGGQPSVATPAYQAPRDRLASFEVAIGLFYAALSGLLFGRGELLAALGLGAFVAFGLLWVGLDSQLTR